jgi:hypothetical protein
MMTVPACAINYTYTAHYTVQGTAFVLSLVS